MKKYIAYLFIISLSFSYLKAQKVNNTLQDWNINILTNKNSSENADLTYAEIKGSPYMNENFIKSKIVNTNGEKISNIPLRYNIYTDKLEFKKEDSILIISNPDKLKHAILEEDTLIYTYYTTYKEDYKNGYFILLKQGQYSLLAKKNIVFLNKTNPEPYQIQKLDRFENRPDQYFLQKQNGIALLLNNKSSLKNLFSDKQEILKFIKKERISVNNKDKLLMFIDYLNNNM